MNGRYIVISSIGITFLDENLINESNNVTFDSEIKYNEVSLQTINIEQFDDGYIIVFFKSTLYNIYIFASNETLISKTENISLTENRENYLYYSLLPYGNSGNKYYFSLIYLLDDSNLKIMKGIFDIVSNIISLEIVFNITAHISLSQYSFSCILMNYYNNEKVINCIYENNEIFTCTNIYPYNNFNYNKCPINSNMKKNIYFKSLVLPGKEESILCSYNFTIFNCFKYNILTNKTINTMNNLEIKAYSLFSQKSILFEYYEETDEILIGVIENVYPIINIIQCTIDLICSDLKEQKLSEKNYITYYNPNIVIPLNQSSYSVFLLYNLNGQQTGTLLKLNITNNYLSSFKTNSMNTNLLCDKFYNYEHTGCLTTIPEGYYCNDIMLKTIDKCHDNCKTCNQGPTTENNNCLTCKEESNNNFFDLGNCSSNCSLGYYTIDTTLICKCSKDIKCGICTEESLQNNLCVTCNKEGNYYPKNDEEIRSDSFINCYKNLEEYYLKNESFYPCYSTCQSCVEGGNENDNNSKIYRKKTNKERSSKNKEDLIEYDIIFLGKI